MFTQIVFCLLLCLITKSDGSNLNSEQRIEEHVIRKQSPQFLKIALRDFKLKNKEHGFKLRCDVCNFMAQIAMNLRKNETNDTKFRKFFVDLCKVTMNTSESVCRSGVEIYTPTLHYILDNTENITSKKICSILMQSFDCVDPNYKPWSIDIPPRTFFKSEKIQQNASSETLKIAHLSDIHYDPLYEAGRLSVGCKSDPCCQNINSKSNNSKTAAGYWGDYNNCDTPWYAILDLLQQVVKQHLDVEMVYLTGDLLNHQMWATSVHNNSECIHKVMNALKEKFKDVPVYPVLGNHESHPANVFAPSNVTHENLSTQWLLDLAAEEWAIWLPEETKGTIKKGGYYTLLHKEGFRIVALNSNVCSIFNFWLIYDDKDPYDQLQWLVNVLLEAERNNEIVHILSHVPFNFGDCWKKWRHEYKKIINRFSSTIAGQFFGHTHLSEISVFYDFSNSDKVVNVAFTAGSFTSYFGGNPSYKIYNIEPTHYNVVNYEEWTYNLTEANQNLDTNPNWFKLYSFAEAYGLKQIDAYNLNDFVQKLSTNSTVLEKYVRFQMRDSPSANSKCDENCLRNTVCNVAIGEFEKSAQCSQVSDSYENTVN